jgi:hypothetical protein
MDKQDRNSFRMGKASHEAEFDTFGVYDENNLELPFQEVWENSEAELRRASLPPVSHVDTQEPGLNSVKSGVPAKTTRDVVFDYQDRFPNSGQ